MIAKRTLIAALARFAILGPAAACTPRQTQVQQTRPTPAAGQPTTAPGATQAPATQQPASGPDVEARRIRKLVFLSNVQAQDPQEFEVTRLVAEDFKKLGLDVDHRAMPWEQQSDVVWYSRDKWDMTSWRMVGRPERMDPDEFIFNLFHSSTAEK